MLYIDRPYSNIPIYNDCKNGLKKPDYIHPSLNILSQHGIISTRASYANCSNLNRFSAGEADILRRAMGKKKRAELERQKERFVNGAVKNGIKKDLANYILLNRTFWDMDLIKVMLQLMLDCLPNSLFKNLL